MVSGARGNSIFIATIELAQNKIKVKKSYCIETFHFIYKTAVLSRYDSNNHLAFDVYYSTCPDPEDLSCENLTLSTVRLDSQLNEKSRTDFSIPAHSLSTQSIQKPSHVDLFLLLWNGDKLEERKLKENGGPIDPLQVYSDGFSFEPSAAEDGRMIAATSNRTGNRILVRTFHPEGRARFLKTKDFPHGMALSGPLIKNSETQPLSLHNKPFRFLFFRAVRDVNTNFHRSRIMKQKIDDATGKFIGKPKAFTKFHSAGFYSYTQSVAVTPKSNLVFYTEVEESCGRTLLKAQVFDPQSSTKVGEPQFLFRCEDFLPSVYGIDVAPLPPKLQ